MTGYIQRRGEGEWVRVETGRLDPQTRAAFEEVAGRCRLEPSEVSSHARVRARARTYSVPRARVHAHACAHACIRVRMWTWVHVLPRARAPWIGITRLRTCTLCACASATGLFTCCVQLTCAPSAACPGSGARRASPAAELRP